MEATMTVTTMQIRYFRTKVHVSHASSNEPFPTLWYQSHLIKDVTFHTSVSQKIKILPLVLLGQRSYPALNANTSETLQAKKLLI